MPNTFAYVVFYTWPLIVLWLHLRYPTKQAIFFATTVSALFLPSAFQIDLPMLPALNRDSITSISILVVLLISGRKFRIFQPGLIIKLVLGYLLVLIVTSSLNSAPLLIGTRYLPGLTYYDAFTEVMNALLWMTPFFLGRYFFNNLKDNKVIFKTIVLVGLVYTLPILLELRISPQLHYLFYGYHASDFIQQARGDGFRPVVFVGHGLPLAFWMSTCAIAAMALHNNKIRVSKPSAKMVVFYLGIILALTKTWSAIGYFIFGAILMYKFTPAKQVKWALIVAFMVMLYPVSKVAGIFPDKEILSQISQYDATRAESMNTRYVNEEVLLEHALKKPFFGWGGWGRNRLYNEYGQNRVITDGRWIIQIGTTGAIGFFFYYAILLTPLYFAAKNFRYIKEPEDRVYFAALAVILTIGLVDSIPNAGMWAMHLLLAGALLGQAELVNKQRNIRI